MVLSDKVNNKCNNLNIFRFVAAIMVIVCHAYAITLNQEDFFWNFNSGQCNLGALAVAFFFFISGLYVTKSLDSKPDLKIFLKKRCFRIFPSLWIVVVLTIFVMGPFFTTLSFKEYFLSFHTWTYSLNMFLIPIHNLPGVFVENLYQTVNGPLWTLPVEFFCYLGLSIIFFISSHIKRHRNLQKFLHIIVLFLLLSIYIVFQYVIKHQFLATVVRPIIFFWEGIVYYYFREKIKLNCKHGIILIVILGLACKTPFYNLVMIVVLPYIVLSLCFGFKDSSHDMTIFKISYEMYLVGWPIQQIVNDVMKCDQTPYMNMLISIPLDILFAYFIYVIVELYTKKRRLNSNEKISNHSSL